MFFKMFLRSFFIQAGWNYERFQNLGFAFCLQPALEKIYQDKDALKAALLRHLQLFNTQPYMASFVLGNVASLEEKAAASPDPEARLMVKSLDTTGNALLEILPERTTINTALERTRNAAGEMQGIGGVDQLHTLHIEVSPPAIAWEISSLNFSAPCYEFCNTEADPVYFNQSTVTFKYSDLGAGLAEILVRKDSLNGEIMQQMVFQNRVYEQLASFTLPDGKYV